MGSSIRGWSVFPVWITGEPAMEYAKVEAVDGTLAIGSRVRVQRCSLPWESGRVVEQPDGKDGHGGGTVWITLGES